MAYSVRFTCLSKKDGSEIFNIEPSWWRVDEVKKLLTCNWKVSNDTGSYHDKDADISVEQARMLHAHFAPEALERIAFNEQCIKAERRKSDKYAAIRLADYVKYVARLRTEFDLIDSAVGVGCDQLSRFHVCIFEWESGY